MNNCAWCLYSSSFNVHVSLKNIVLHSKFVVTFDASRLKAMHHRPLYFFISSKFNTSVINLGILFPDSTYTLIWLIKPSKSMHIFYLFILFALLSKTKDLSLDHEINLEMSQNMFFFTKNGANICATIQYTFPFTLRWQFNDSMPKGEKE